MKIYRDFTFEAAHFLPLVPSDHKCRSIHGHSWSVRIYVKGPVNPCGWVVDFADIDQNFSDLFKILDHSLLNDFIDNPTSENVALFIFQNLPKTIKGATVCGVTIGETCRGGVVFEP